MKENRVERLIVMQYEKSLPENEEQARQIAENFNVYKGRISRFHVLLAADIDNKEAAVKEIDALKHQLNELKQVLNILDKLIIVGQKNLSKEQIQIAELAAHLKRLSGDQIKNLEENLNACRREFEAKLELVKTAPSATTLPWCAA